MTKIEKILLALLPALAPVSTGYIVLRAFLAGGWFWLPAGIAALALELLGYFSARLILSVWEHNRTLSATEKGFAVSTWRAWLPIGAYVIIALYLTIFVELVPAAFIGSYLAFPFIGLLSAWVTAEYRVLENHAEKKNEARAIARDAAQKARDEKKQAAETAAKFAQVPSQPEPKPAKVARKHVTDSQLLAELDKNPGASDEQVAQVFGLSRQSINERRHKLQPALIKQVTK